jgi:hypothetical protein
VLVRVPGRSDPDFATLVGPLARFVPVEVGTRPPEAKGARQERPHAARFAFEGFRAAARMPGVASEPWPLPPHVPFDGTPCLILTERPDGSMSGGCAGPVRLIEDFLREVDCLS